MLDERQRGRLSINLARDKAEVLLAGLIHAQRAFDRCEPPPCCSRIVSRRSMDQAIGSTRRLIMALDRIMTRAPHEESEWDECDRETS